MPRTREIEKVGNFLFTKPIRAIFSGSSQSGKTYLIGKILEKQNQLFGDEFQFIKYFYPTYLEESPVDYHTNMDTPISYECGFPKRDDILSLPPNSLVIIDDQADEVVKSDLINQLYKVISGKRNISVICVTQNYFLQGKHSRDIRNSCNYVALFRNCADHRLNVRVATAFGLKDAYVAAEKETYRDKIYPYFFIDQTQRAQLSDYRLYIDILGPVKISFSSSGMKGYILSETDFESAYKIIGHKKKSVLAIKKHENSHETVPKSTTQNKKIKSESKKRKREIHETPREYNGTSEGNLY